MEKQFPTQWSADLREGLTMQEISYVDTTYAQLKHIYYLYNLLSYP